MEQKMIVMVRMKNVIPRGKTYCFLRSELAEADFLGTGGESPGSGEKLQGVMPLTGNRIVG
jgi:hypothetical protein